jgi:hypothetical protein
MKKLLAIFFALFFASLFSACSAEAPDPDQESVGEVQQATGTCPYVITCPTAQPGYRFMYTMQSYNPPGVTCWYTNGFGGQYSVVIASEPGCQHCCPGGWGCPGWCPSIGICPNPSWWCQAT